MHFPVIFLNFFVWWYGEGLIRLLRYEAAFFSYLKTLFSVKESVYHLFSPWKRLVGKRRPGLDGFRDWLVDNLISRGVGFVMRITLLIVFMLSSTIYLLGCLFFIALWVGWPIILPLGLYWGFKNV